MINECSKENTRRHFNSFFSFFFSSNFIEITSKKKTTNHEQKKKNKGNKDGHKLHKDWAGLSMLNAQTQYI